MPDPLKWITDPTSDLSPEALGTLIEGVLSEGFINQYGQEAADTDRGKAQIEYLVLNVLSQLPNQAEGEFSRRVIRASRNGMYHYMPGEFDTIEDLLNNLLDNAKSQAMISDLSYITNEVVPWLEAHGMGDQVELIGPRGGVRDKIRAAIPQLRNAQKDSESRDDVDASWKRIFQQVNDPNENEDTIRNRNPQHAGRIPVIEVREYTTGEGNTVIVAKLDARQSAFLKNRLQKKANFTAESKWVIHPELGNARDVVAAAKSGEGIDFNRMIRKLETAKTEIERLTEHVQMLARQAAG